jgi:hypothetical protein
MTEIPSQPTSQTEEIAADNNVIVAGPGRYYRNTRYIMLLVLVGMGIWFGYDGFVGWPKLNQQIASLQAEQLQAQRQGNQKLANEISQRLNQLGTPKTDWDLGLQKLLCFALPPLGIGLLIRALYNSRGEYRLEGTTLHVPGHPPVPFDNISEIDRRLWDKKGIAYASYDLGDGRQGTLRLDDFVYDRPPTDAIFERMEKHVNPVVDDMEEKESE